MFSVPYAHRGLWSVNAPENSRAAFRAAVKAGVGIELDVQLSADGVPMVFHDATLKRLCGRPEAVSDLDAETLCSITLGSSPETIPTLAEVLGGIDGQVPVLVELKTPFGREGVLELSVAETLWGYDGDVAVISFNPAALAMMRLLAPRVMRGQTTYSWRDDKVAQLTHHQKRHLRQLAFLDEVKPDFLCVGADALPAEHIRHWRQSGLPVIAWTARSAQMATRLLRHADTVMFEGFSQNALKIKACT